MCEYLTIPYVALDVKTSSVAILADRSSDVESVMPDAVARPDLADSGPLVQADQAWSVGYDGSGVAVGIVEPASTQRIRFWPAKWPTRRVFEHRRRGE